MVTVPDEDEKSPQVNCNGWETGGYKNYAFRLLQNIHTSERFPNKTNLCSLKDDLEDRADKLQRMYERPLSASAGMLNTKRSKKTTLDRVTRMRAKQRRKAQKAKRRRDSHRDRL